MRIITQGVKPKPISWRDYGWRCNSCRMLVAWDGDSDVGVYNIHAGNDRTFGTAGFLHATCPVCEHETTWWRELLIKEDDAS